MSRHKSVNTGPSAGSNAGRGFRYQDHVGALFLTRMYFGEAGYEAVIPEGSDDYLIRTPDGDILVDTKSSRARARTRNDMDDTVTLKKLWARPLAAGVQIAEYWVVSERSRMAPRGRQSAVVLFGTSPPPRAARSFLLNEPDPVRDAVELLVRHRGLTLLAAELVVLAFAKAVGELASANGPLPLDLRLSITQSEVELIASRVLAAVDSERLEEIVLSGFLRVVDFVTPMEDAGFYLGVDVQPGHFCSGLALERPEAAARVVDALQRTRAVAIRGPSGAGKSGLMWNAVLTTRDARRWFRVNPGIKPAPQALTAFFEAYAGFDVGFVIDDIGRGGIDAWTDLRHHCQAHPRAVMLGSIRSEDVVLLPARHAIAEIDVVPDQQLAEALWRKLRELGHTNWAGWIEPWNLSNGLLLEYGHILAAGARLERVVLDQVRERLQQGRDDELSVLRATALVAAHGGAIRIDSLQQHLGLSTADMARALQRLLAEHLVRIDEAGSALTGLHALRASAISMALVEIAYATRETQAHDALRVADCASLEALTAGVLTSRAISADAAGDALASRLSAQTSLRELAAAVRGLRSGGVTESVRDWLKMLNAIGVPRKFATFAAMMGITPATSFHEIEALRKPVQLGRELHASIVKQRIPRSLASTLLECLSGDIDNASTMDRVEALSALAKATLTPEQQSTVAALPISLDDIAIADVVNLLDAAEAIHPDVAAAWVRRASGKNLLERLSAETPFALAIEREDTEEGVIVHGDLYEAALTQGENSNDRLVAHVHAILRLEPDATLAHVRLVDSSGETSLHLDAEKRIRRENSPPHAMVQINRRVIDVVAAEVAGQSWSHYLTRGAELLRSGLGAFRRLLDGIMMGRVNQQALDELNRVVDACDDLIAPVDPPQQRAEGLTGLSGRHLNPLQNVIFSTNATLVKRIADLPANAASLAMHVEDLVAQSNRAKEDPWFLIDMGIPRELEILQVLLRQIVVVALDADASGLDPRQRWRKPDGKVKDAFAHVSVRSERSLDQRIEACRSQWQARLRQYLPGAEVIAPMAKDGILWRSLFVATFPIERLADLEKWIDEARATGERIRAEVNDFDDIVLVPAVHGCAAVEFSYQLSRGRSGSIVGSMLAAAGQESFLLKPDQDVVNRIGLPVLQHPIELERVFQALADCAGLHGLGLGGLDRPQAERARMESAVATIKRDSPKLLESFQKIDRPAFTTLRACLNMISTDDEVEGVVPSPSPREMQLALAEWTWLQSKALSA